MSVTRPTAFTTEELEKVEKLLEKVIHSGAKINMLDSRVTNAQTWVLATIGVSLMGIGGWGIKSINELNQTMTRVVTQNEYRDAQVNRIERHIESIDERVVTLERKAR